MNDHAIHFIGLILGLFQTILLFHIAYNTRPTD